MSIFNWLFDRMASEDIIDLHFILSDMKDVFIPESEHLETQHYDSYTRSRGNVSVKNGHVFKNGKDMGPVGKYVE